MAARRGHNWWMVVMGGVLLAGCMGTATTGQVVEDGPRDQVEREFGPINDEQIAGFEREVQFQYRDLYRTYDKFDEVAPTTPREQAEASDDDAKERLERLHRQLQRRHERLAHLHQDRMWFDLRRDGPSQVDRELAEAHREAAQWHQRREAAGLASGPPYPEELQVIREVIRRQAPASEESAGAPRR